MSDYIGTATYSPEDNKIRIDAYERLSPELYKRVRDAGFIWAPRQKIFVAPMWTPDREDLALELCGEIGDEDKSLVERAEERAERFEEYSDKREQDANRAHAAVAAIADNIPLGQPILVGHHSERHARKDAERIENGMRRAVKMWETSKYWEDRAAGALAHARYLERPDVRARRIKGLESDIRVMRAKYTPDPRTKPIMQSRWNAKPGDPKEEHVWCGSGSRGGSWVPVASLPGLERYYSRWIAHCENRLLYERAMLAESGGLPTDNVNLEIGGRVLVRGEWVTITKLNKKAGKVISVTTNARYVRIRPVEEIKEYEPPSQEQATAAQAAAKVPPLCNYPGLRFATCTQAEWDAIHKDARGVMCYIAETDTVERHRVRHAMGYRVHLPAAEGKELEPGYCSANRTHKFWPVFITDAKRKDPPTRAAGETPMPKLAAPARELPEARAYRPKEEPTVFDAMKESLKAGVKVVSAPQLFPTPPDLARRMADIAAWHCGGSLAGKRMLDPEAGTGNLIRAAMNAATGFDCYLRVTAVEISSALVSGLEEQRRKTLYANDSNFKIVHADFLDLQPSDLEQFDVILMNPPFKNGEDIKHINHARQFLKPGGILVAICAGGPRQEEQLKTLTHSWVKLPEGTFKESGTGVNTVLLTIHAPGLTHDHTDNGHTADCGQCQREVLLEHGD